MRNILLGYVGITCIVLAGFGGNSYANEKPGSTGEKTAVELKRLKPNIIKKSTITIPKSNLEILVENKTADFFNATVYTFNDITLFSYFDGTAVTITDSAGLQVAAINLDANQQSTTTLSSGIYHLSGNQSYTTLVGDALSSAVQGFFAVDQSGRGLSTLLNTYMVNNAYGAEKFIVFGYSDNTSVSIRNLDTQDLLFTGTVGRGEHIELPNVPFGTFLQVSSDKPVSALSYGDQDYYVPSDNGTFAGNTFFGYSAYIGSWTNSVTVSAYNDGTTGTIVNTDTGAEIAAFSLSEGQVFSLPINAPTYWSVVTDQKVSVSNLPFSGWSGNYFYMTRAIDESGFGVGTVFYVSTIASRIDVFSFSDSNQVRITQLGDYQSFPYDSPTVVNIAGKTPDAQGYFSLSSNEVATFSSTTGQFVYKVEANEPVSVLQSNGGAGADFMPLNYALNLSDLSISSDKITFSPQADIYNEGDQIQISLSLENVGFEVADNIDVYVYDGKPGKGIVPILSKFVVDSISASETKSVSFNYRVPSDPNYRSLFVAIDPEGKIIESNPTNNLIEKSLVLRQDLQLPLTVNIDAPGGLELDGNIVTSAPFNIQMDLFNLGVASENNLVVTLQLLDGLSLLAGEQSSVNLSELQVNNKMVANWQVLADPNVSGPNRYEISVESTNVSKTIRRLINVPDTIVPAAPTNLSADESSDGSISIKWQGSQERDLIGFNLFQKNGSQFELVSTLSGATVSSFVIANPQASISVYGISAVDSSNNTSSVAEITVNEFSPPPPPPPAPESGGGSMFFLLGLLCWLTFLAKRKSAS